MPIYRVDVGTRPGLDDKFSQNIEAALCEQGVAPRNLKAFRVFLIEGEIDPEAVARAVLADPITECFEISEASEPKPFAVQIFKKPGVMDPVEASARKAISDLGFSVRNVRTGLAVRLEGVSGDALKRAVFRSLANEVVDDVYLGGHAFTSLSLGKPYHFQLKRVKLTEHLAKELALSRDELEAIRAHFEKLGRDPTDVEVETIAQTWSEHCKHKTFNSEIEFNGEIIPNLLRTTIFQATQELNKPWCVSVFKDNAGIVEFDEKFNVCFKVETHNHPSAIEPYGGASTGVGGVIRDILGCGLGAKPIANIDVFAVGMPDVREADLLPGVIHPKRLLKGVVAGVRDYGNRMGIPTVAGAVIFDNRYLGNPLVYCGTVGVIPRDKSWKRARTGDLIVVAGGRTGRDGIHGATFSSAQLDESSERVSQSAVQIGNAIVQKKLLDALLEARDQGLYTCVTDCGAGGLSSAVGEMGEELGAEVELDRVPLKYEGLSYTEIWISEAQERMVLAVPPPNVQALLEVCRTHDVEATVIGRFTDTRRLVLRYQGTEVANLEMEFLHHGLPRSRRRATWNPTRLPEPRLEDRPEYTEDLLRLLAHPNVASKEWIIRQYDHEVQGGSVIKPLCGPERDGPSDAAVVRPRLDSYRGVAIGLGINSRYSDIDPYWMAACAIDEAMRNVVSVGADPERVALLDNFSWAGPGDPEVLGALVLAARACRDVARAYGTPFISGKDSLNNEFVTSGRTIRIPHTLLISALGLVHDVRRCVTMDAKAPGHGVYIVGVTRPELGGSLFYAVHGHTGSSVPQVDLKLAPKIFAAVARAIREGCVAACHDVSEGGMAVALAEMAFAGGVGLEIELQPVPRANIRKTFEILFSESPTRFIVEAADEEAFECAMKDVPFAKIGRTTHSKRLVVEGVIDASLDELKAAWKAPLAW